MLTTDQRRIVEQRARAIRRHIIEMTWTVQSGHPGGSLSLADIMAMLYFHELRHDPGQPNWPDRDRVVLSKGHAAPVWYATLAEAGYFAVDELTGLRQTGRLLEGHPCIKIPGVDATTGSLGLGLSAACGMAVAARRQRRDSIRVFAILGDGELGEGQIWEAALAAPHLRLDNLVAIIDRNRYQNDGATADILGTEPLAEKWVSFGWSVQQVDGHDLDALAAAFARTKDRAGKPHMLVADTVKGKGVSYLIDKPELHYKAPTAEQRESALQELSEAGPGPARKGE